MMTDGCEVVAEGQVEGRADITAVMDPGAHTGAEVEVATLNHTEEDVRIHMHLKGFHIHINFTTHMTID